MVEIVKLNELWTAQEPLEIENEKYWLKLRVKTHPQTGQKYYDILSGSKGEDPHLHYGFDLMGNRIFELPRGRVHRSRLEVESLLYGKILDETKILKDSDGKIDFVIAVTIRASSRESWIERFEFKPTTIRNPASPAE